jgi:hypothetical protein
VKVNNPALYRGQLVNTEAERSDRNRRVKLKMKEERRKRREAKAEGKEYTIQMDEEDLAYKAEREERNHQKKMRRQKKTKGRKANKARKQAKATHSSADVGRQPAAPVEQKPLPAFNNGKPVSPVDRKPKVVMKKEPVVKVEKKREVIVLDD